MKSKSVSALTEQSTVSIIIPTYNRPTQLIRLIESINLSSYKLSDLEIIVIDNQGNLSERTLLKASPNVKISLHKSHSNLFSGGGRRLGAKYAKGNYIFFVDDDNVLEEECISKLTDAFKTDSSYGVLAPLMFNYTDKNIIWSAGGKINRLGLTSYIHAGLDIRSIKLPKVIAGVDFFPNAYMTKREILSSTNFSDSAFIHNWAEADFSFRVKRQKLLLGTVTDAQEWHDIGRRGLVTRLNKNTIYDQAVSRIIFRRIYLNSFSAWLLFWFIVFPLSSFSYIKGILKSENGRFELLKLYLKGTIDAIHKPIDYFISINSVTDSHS